MGKFFLYLLISIVCWIFFASPEYRLNSIISCLVTRAKLCLLTRQFGIMNAYYTWISLFVEGRKEQSARQHQLRESLNSEETVVSILHEFGWEKVYLRRRVYSEDLHHSKEIDVIAVGPQVLVIEVKNWRGYIWSSQNFWYQQPTTTAPGKKFHNLYQDVIERAVLLRKFFEGRNRLVFPCTSRIASNTTTDGSVLGNEEHFPHTSSSIVPVLLFTNSNAHLEPRTVSKNPNIFTMGSFRDFLESQSSYLINANSSKKTSWKNKLMNIWQSKWSFQGFLKSSSIIANGSTTSSPHNQPNFSSMVISRELSKRVEDILERCHTWDEIVMLNGRRIHGDVLSLYLKSIKIRYDRASLKKIELEWVSSSYWGLLLSLLAGSAGKIQIQLNSSTKKKNQILNKHFLKDHDPENGRSYSFPVVSTGNLSTKSDYISLRLAGQNEVEEIPLVLVRHISLGSKRSYSDSNQKS